MMASPVLATSLYDIHNSTFMLVQEGSPICSGTFISPTRFVTAAHCVEAKQVKVNDKVRDIDYGILLDDGKTIIHLTMNKENRVFDTASLDVIGEWSSPYYVEVAPMGYLPTTGDKVVISAYPLALGYEWLVEGLYSETVRTPPGLADSSKNGWSYVVSVMAAPGSSGGGIFTLIDGEYKLIGTMEGNVPTYPFMSFVSIVAGVRYVAGNG